MYSFDFDVTQNIRRVTFCFIFFCHVYIELQGRSNLTTASHSVIQSLSFNPNSDRLTAQIFFPRVSAKAIGDLKASSLGEMCRAR